MEFISLVFRLGVVLAIFSFIWGILRFLLTILRGGLPLSYPFKIGLKTLQYFLIAELTILFCIEQNDGDLQRIILTGLILLMYFIGKVQNMQFKMMMIQIQGRGMQTPEKPNMRLEFGIVLLAMSLFTFLALYPDYAYNGVSKWFYTSIIDIETTPIFGFIFKIVGFFFSLGILFRMVNSISMILSGKAFGNRDNGSKNNPTNDDPNHFDDYEEIS
ncbi:MAG: hypothetical protein IT221_09115 [Fluviicola sp.]|nr:hypothetical protein [Fluviicola sp.]